MKCVQAELRRSEPRIREGSEDDSDYPRPPQDRGQREDEPDRDSQKFPGSADLEKVNPFYDQIHFNNNLDIVDPFGRDGLIELTMLERYRHMLVP